MKNIKVIFFLFAPILIALTCITIRVDENASLLSPDLKARSWQLETHATVTGENRVARVEIGLPLPLDRYEVISENFISNGFAVAILSDHDRRRAVWTGFAHKDQTYDFYYRAQIQLRKAPIPQKSKMSDPQPAKLKGNQVEYASSILKLLEAENLSEADFIEDLIKEVLLGNSKASKQLRKSAKTTPAKANLLANILRLKGIPARVVHGIRLTSPDRTAHFFPWLEFQFQGAWHQVDVKRARLKIPGSWFAWKRNNSPLFKSRAVSNAKSSISVSPHDIAAPDSKNLQQREHFLLTLSDFPVEAQALFRILLVIPVGALVVAFLRCIVGIRTMGTFMPVLIALSFRETELLWGLALYTAVIFFSLIARYCFEHLQLLVVPRLTATLTLVVLVVLSFTTLLQHFSVNSELSVALFPIVILTMMIERISIMLEELGAIKACAQTALSLGVAALVYLVISSQYLEYYMFTFPELLLVVLSISILFGRFTGYRLTELYRFRSFLRSSS